MSCHDLQTNGASTARHERRARRLKPSSSTRPRSSMCYAQLSSRLGGKLQTFEVGFPALALESPGIMGTSFAEVLQKLNRDLGVRREFVTVYGRPPDALKRCGRHRQTVSKKLCVTPGSRFDRWLAGDAAALAAEELDGYRLYKSLGCVSCHQGVNIVGNLVQRHGIFRPLASPQPEILRVPSLRNVATTPPYFHDGSAPTLDDAGSQMGAAQVQFHADRPAGNPRSLPISKH